MLSVRQCAEQVGKSTLITSLIKETFVPNVSSREKGLSVPWHLPECAQIQHVVPEVTIPPEWTREKVTTRIVDSSGV